MPQRLHILHIENEPAILDMVRMALIDEMEVDRALSLAAAHEQIAIQSYDMLLVDLMLDDSAGVDTVNALKGYGIPMVVLSAVDRPEVLAACAAAGADDYILKPGITLLRLLNRLRFAHARHQRCRENLDEDREWKASKKKRYLDEAALEALKPFITCGHLVAA
jgi:two-component system OmpR family response regulator